MILRSEISKRKFNRSNWCAVRIEPFNRKDEKIRIISGNTTKLFGSKRVTLVHRQCSIGCVCDIESAECTSVCGISSDLGNNESRIGVAHQIGIRIHRAPTGKTAVLVQITVSDDICGVRIGPASPTAVSGVVVVIKDQAPSRKLPGTVRSVVNSL